MRPLLTIVALAALTAGNRLDADVVRLAADVSQIAFVTNSLGIPFELDCTVLLDSLADQPDISVMDASGATILRKVAASVPLSFRAGDRLHVRGTTAKKSSGCPCAMITSCTTTGHVAAPPIADVSSEDIESGRFDCHPVRIRGTIADYFTSGTGDCYLYLLIDSDGTTVSAICHNCDASKIRIGTRITAVGIVFPGSYSFLRFKGRRLGIENPLDITLSDDHPANLFDVPQLDEITLLSPASIQKLGRRKVAGNVLAVWDANLLLKTDTGHYPIKVDIARQEMPACGQRVEISGLADTDLYQLHLCRANWRPSDDPPAGDAPASNPEPILLFSVPDDAHSPNPKLNGQIVRVRGAVFGLPNGAHGDGSLLVKTGAELMPVETSANPDCLDGISVGCTVEITGVCVLEAERWRTNAVFPRVLCYRIVPRSAADVVVTARPPWWTTGRLLTVISTLAATLLALLLWNVTLKRLVRIKSREIADSEIARAEAAVKVYERTRLAVELHDSVAQNLTGVSMEIRAAQKSGLQNPDGLNRHLNMATLTLESCRSDLRDCLWDLRNLTLEEGSMEDAIRKTLAPHLGDAELAVRFSVDRERFTDNTMYTILRILRELATNAVRHGQATLVKVAGSIENGKLLFSVRDNGCGFDPATAPSMSEGHFGLRGIRDRINILDGTMSIESVPGKGTRVSLALTLPTEAKT